MSNIIEVEIKISDLVHDLRAGLTWFASEDKGQGSIQERYDLEDEDILDIQSHPAFNEPIRKIKIVDDYTKKPSTSKPIVQVVPEFQEVISNTEPQPVAEDAGALEFLSL